MIEAFNKRHAALKPSPATQSLTAMKNCQLRNKCALLTIGMGWDVQTLCPEKSAKG